MAKRPSVEKAGKLLIAAMRETAEAGDKEGFELVLRAWDLDGPRRIFSVAAIFSAICSSDSRSR